MMLHILLSAGGVHSKQDWELFTNRPFFTRWSAGGPRCLQASAAAGRGISQQCVDAASPAEVA